MAKRVPATTMASAGVSKGFKSLSGHNKGRNQLKISGGNGSNFL